MTPPKIISALFTLILLAYAPLSDALLYDAEGFGKSKPVAEKEALEKLGQVLFEHFKTQHCSQKQKQNSQLCTSVWHANELPLYEVRLTVVKSRPWVINATMDSKTALPVYQTKLDLLTKNLRELKNASKKTSKGSFGNLENLQLSLLYQHFAVAKSLDQNLALNVITDIEKLYNTKSGKDAAHFDALPQGIVHVSDILKSYQTSKLANKPMLVLPPMFYGSREITPLAAVFSSALKESIRNAANSNAFVDMRYKESGKNRLQFDFRIIERHKGALYSGSFTLDTAAADKLRFEPRLPKFEEKLAQNAELPQEQAQNTKTAAAPVKQNALSGEIYTQDGSQNLLFKPGDTIKLYVKLNRPGYFYIVGHIKQDDDEYSYLVDLGDSAPQFVYKVGPDKAGTAIELGEFDVEAPFGTEYLQLFASESDLKAFLPKATMDERLGYFIIDGSKNNIAQGLDTVRGLVRNCSAEGTRGLSRNECGQVTVEAAKNQPKPTTPPTIIESLLAFTTMEVQCANVRGLSRNCTPVSTNSAQQTPSPGNCENDKEGDKVRGLSRNCP